MQTENTAVIKIKTYDGGMLRVDKYRSCEIILASRGMIRTTFTRGFKYSDDLPGTLPVREIYEYQVKEQKLQAIFEKYDVFSFKSEENNLSHEEGSWEMAIYSTKDTKKMSGFAPPYPHGEEFVKAVKKLLVYKVEPFIFSAE